MAQSSFIAPGDRCYPAEAIPLVECQPNEQSISLPQGYSCAELKEQGVTKSGIYYLLIRGTSFWYLKVYCDMEAANGGWTVIFLG